MEFDTNHLIEVLRIVAMKGFVERSPFDATQEINSVALVT